MCPIVNATTVYGRKKIKISKEQFEEIMGYLDFLNTGIWVSITDEIIDLNPSDEEIIETADYVCWMIKSILGSELDEFGDIRIKPPRTIGGVRFNFAAWAYNNLKRACTANPSVRVKLIVDRGSQAEKVGLYLLSEDYAA